MAISLSGSLEITGSIFASGGITGSFSGTATSASYATNADLLDNRDSTTFANTGSNAFAGSQNINGNVAITGSLTTTGTIIAQTLNVQQVTSSIIYSSGSNVFGNSLSNTQVMTGSVSITGSLSVNGSLSGTSATFSSTLTGTDIQLRGTIDPFTSNISTITLGGTNATHSGNINFQVNGVSKSFIVHRAGNLTSYLTGTEAFAIENPGGIRLLVNSSGAATFSSTVTATGGYFYGQTTNSFVRLDNSIGSQIAYTNYSVIIDTEGVKSITNGSERMRITQEGYLGITTTTDTVSAGDLLGVLSFVSKDLSTFSSGGVTNIRSYATTTYNTGNISGDLRFYVSDGLQNTTGTYLFGTERMRITSGGNVGIGTTSPASPLTINATTDDAQFRITRAAQTNQGLSINAGAGRTIFNSYEGTDTAFGSFIFESTKGATTVERMRINSSGNVLIGTTSDVSAKIYIVSSATYGIVYQDTSNANNFYVGVAGDGYLRAASWSYGSDRRIKENIKYIKTGINKVLALKPATFDYIDGIKNNIGWIAQDVQEVIPEAVGTISETNDQLTLKSDFIIPYLVKAIQEQQAQIESQQSQIEALKLLIK
jgi:hypothetical protein